MSDPRVLFVQSFRNLGFSQEDATGLERGCYNEVIRQALTGHVPVRRNWDDQQFRAIYATRLGTLQRLSLQVQSLLRAGNPAFDVGQYSERQLVPEQYRDDEALIGAKNSAVVTEKYYTMFRCPACGVSKHLMDTSQTRSLDEEPTYKCKCVCGNRFNGKT